MNRSKVIIFVLILVVLTCGTVIAANNEVPKKINLLDCVTQALANHPDIMIAEFELVEAKLELQKLQTQLPGTIASKELLKKEELVRQTEEALKEAKMQLAYTIESKYYLVLKAIEALKNKEYLLEWAKKEMEIVQIKYDSGLIPEKELKSMTESLSEQKENYKVAKFYLGTTLMEFNLVLGFTLDQTISLEEERFPFEPLEVNLDEIIVYAQEHAQTIKQAKKTLVQAQETLELKQLTNAAGVDIVKANHELKKAEFALQKAQDQLIIQMRNTYIGIVTATRETDNAKQDYEQKQLDLEILTIKYDAGLISLNDLLKAQQNLEEAHTSWIQAIYQYNLTKADFYKSMGMNYSLYQAIEDQGSDNNE